MATKKLHHPHVLMSLSARLLMLTWLFTMMAEFLIFAPSISRFRKVFLEEQVATGELAAMAIEAAPNSVVSAELEDRLLLQAGVRGVILRRQSHTTLALTRRMPEKIDLSVDLHEYGYLSWVSGAFDTLMQTENRVVRILGYSAMDPNVRVEILMDETPMRQAMYGYSERILALSFLISMATATWVYIGLQFLMVLPMRRITESMVHFREDPENEVHTLPSTRRSDEIGVAQRELIDMQNNLRAALRQKERLAALGAAMAKINHDLRNTLATAMLISDSLARSEDPDVRQLTPRLFDTIDKAVALCSQTLEFAREEPPKPMKRQFFLEDIVDEARAMSEPLFGQIDDQPAGLRWSTQIPGGLEVEVDRDLIVRVLTNLARNAREAGATAFKVTAERDAKCARVIIADDGPGMPEKARENMFKPFLGSTKKGGTGLGLVIAREIMIAHGGDINLAKSDANGTHFELIIPAAPSAIAPPATLDDDGIAAQ